MIDSQNIVCGRDGSHFEVNTVIHDTEVNQVRIFMKCSHCDNVVTITLPANNNVHLIDQRKELYSNVIAWL